MRTRLVAGNWKMHGSRAANARVLDAIKAGVASAPGVAVAYSYGHSGYQNDNASTKVMEVGYVDGAYWNSYLDGSATIDELLAMRLYERLSGGDGAPAIPGIRGLIPSPDGLVVKYSRLTERYAFDKSFFEEMDKKGTWLPIPYPKEKLQDVHHREGYPARFSSQHAALCGALETHLRSAVQGGGTTATSCPAGCVVSTYCKEHPNASTAIKVNGLPCVVAGAGGCQPCR